MSFFPVPKGGKQNHHGERAEEQITHLAAEFIARMSNGTSLITVTRSVLTSKGDRVVIFVTVFPENMTTFAIEFLNRNRDEFRTHLKEKARLRMIPSILFEEDYGEKNRQHLEDISRKPLA